MPDKIFFSGKKEFKKPPTNRKLMKMEVGILHLKGTLVY